MKNNKLWFLVFTAAGSIVGYLILQSDLQAGSTGDVLVRLGKALFYGSGALAFIFLILLFIPQAFPAWKKFAVWFVPLAALLFIVYPNPGSGDLFSPYPEQIFRWVSGLYVAASILIIAVKYISLRKS